MISLDECREILGETAHGLSDDELAFLRQQLYGLADIAITIYLTKKNKDTTSPAKEPSG